MKQRLVTEETLISLLREHMHSTKRQVLRGMTIEDLSEKSGICVAITRLQMRNLILLGKAEMIKEIRPTIAGYSKRTPVYVIKKDEGARKG